ncbi:MAG: polyphenol oxidase family protein [Gemmatimonadaceae bacterium]|nr:polyphenol oxidase family protein [Gemmatimonadaceae bacterium]
MTLPERLVIPDFEEWGMTAFTTARAAGSYGTHAEEPVSAVLGRWHALVGAVAALGAPQFATAAQVHGDRIVAHGSGWEGWLRAPAADGHAWLHRGVAAAVTVADCVPVFIGHPSGAGALLHSGWRGTVAGITEQAIAWFAGQGLAPGALRVHLGPSICGACYEVSPDVYAQLTGSTVQLPTRVDLRALIADRCRRLGVREVATSAWCTRCAPAALFSHRGGDPGRQLGVLITPATRK